MQTDKLPAEWRETSRQVIGLMVLMRIGDQMAAELDRLRAENEMLKNKLQDK